jgi:hypothetical protein
VPWGASEDQLREKLSIDSCFTPDREWLGERICSGSLALGGVDFKTSFAFRRAQFVRAVLTFKSRDFEQVAAMFVERYPTGDETKPYKTPGRTGIVEPNLELAWTDDLDHFTALWEPALQRASPMLATRAELEESARLRQEQTKGAAKGL